MPAPLRRSPYDTDEFRTLQAKWDRKLARKGFVDIECTTEGVRQDDTPYMRGHSLRLTRSHKRGLWLKNEEWYRLAGQWLYDTDWSTRKYPWAGYAWELVAEGGQHGEVQAALKKRGYKVGPVTLRRFINEESAAMTQARAIAHEHTALSGERVVVEGVLVEPCGPHRWRVEMPGGEVVEVEEEDMRYAK